MNTSVTDRQTDGWTHRITIAIVCIWWCAL